MTSRLDTLVIDANDAHALARFWGELLGWKLRDEGDGDWVLEPTDGTPFELLVEPVPEPKVGKNRIHLDLTSTSDDDQRAFVARALELGAHYIDVGQAPTDGHVVLADPEGNELCVIEPENQFLAGITARVGSITCDGTPVVGRFWSAALGWPLVWDQDDETAIRAPDGTGPYVTFGPPVPPKTVKNRLHLDITPTDVDQETEVERLIALGARRIDIGQGEQTWVVMADPDDNEFCVLAPK